MLYTFADEHQCVFTVVNVPPIIHPIATTTNPDLLTNCSLGRLLCPQLSIKMFPELLFLLHKLPVANLLLS